MLAKPGWYIGMIVVFATCTCSSFQLHAHRTADSIIITEHFVEVSLGKAFEHLEDKYQLKLAYDPALADSIIISRRIEGLEVAEAFRQLLRGTPLSFRMIDARHVLIRDTSVSRSPKSNTPPTLSGRVVDARSGQPLPYASIRVIGARLGTSCEADGAFRLRLPPGTDSLQLEVQYLGYYSRRFGAEAMRDGVLELRPKIHEISPITVKGNRPLHRLVSPKEGQSLQGALFSQLPTLPGGADPLRSLQLLPGIQAADDFSAGLRVRGGRANENLIILDGIPLYKLDHFFGIFSTINPAIIGDISLYKNAFPAEYGGRTSSVVVMESHTNNSGATNGGIEANLLTSNAHVQIPLHPQLDLSLAGRWTNGNISDNELFGQFWESNRLQTTRPTSLRENIIVPQEPDFRFYDLNGRLDWQLEGEAALTLSYFGSGDRYENIHSRIFTTRDLGRLFRNEERFHQEADWRNGGWSLRARRNWSPRQKSEISLSRSGFRQEQEILSRLVRISQRERDTLDQRDVFLNDMSGWNIRMQQRGLLPSGAKWMVGYQGAWQAAELRLGVDDQRLLDAGENASEQAVFGQWDQPVAEQWELRGGLRATHYAPKSKMYVSPRLRIKRNLTSNAHLRASWGYYYQFLREITYEDRYGRPQQFLVLADGAQFSVAGSNHLALGGAFGGQGFRLDIEAYHKRTQNVMEYALLFNGFRGREYVFFEGQGVTRGIDLLLEKNSGAYTGWVAYTLSKSDQRFPDILDGAAIPAQNDQRHQLQWVHRYRLGDWLLSGAYVFGSGRPYTDLAALNRMAPVNDRRIVDLENRIRRLKAYHRVDLGVAYRFRISGFRSRARFSIFNLFNRQNVKYRQYIYQLEQTNPLGNDPRELIVGSDLQLLDRTLNFAIEVEF